MSILRLSAKNVKLLRPTLYGYITTREEFINYSEELFEILVKEKLDVNIHKVYPLSEVGTAHTDLEGRKTTGKLLLDPSK